MFISILDKISFETNPTCMTRWDRTRIILMKQQQQQQQYRHNSHPVQPPCPVRIQAQWIERSTISDVDYFRVRRGEDNVRNSLERHPSSTERIQVVA
mmetsp:Transcript_21932/g.40917  ORF Transcript_21932/g.40917 Transcript_21932/m.40917 type:complete len:97 (-) Transcript_21932:183-473(-)